MPDLKIQQVDDGVVLTAKIVPGSSRMSVCGLLDGMLKIKVSAEPQKGRANQSLLRFLAKQLNMKKNTVSIISGQTKQVKEILVSGISAEMLLKKLDLDK